MKAQDVILGLLMKEDLTGYEIKKCFETTFSFFFDASYGSVYPTLKKMESEQLIRKRSVIQEGKPNKNVYSLTESGKEQFQSYLESAVEGDAIRSDLCVKLYFGRYADPQVMLTWMKEGIIRNEQTVKQLELVLTQFQEVMDDSQILCVQIGLSYHRSQLDVLRQGLVQMTNKE